MLKLRKTNRNNIEEILKLEVFDNQKSFAATNNSSIIEAYIAILRIMMYLHLVFIKTIHLLVF